MENETDNKIISDADNQLLIDAEDGDKVMEDAMKLLNIFPEEVWIHILEGATDNVKENLCNSSPFFRNLLFHERTLFLFSKVWNILCVKYHQRQLPISDAEPSRFRNDPSTEILKCRLICHKWCDTIDKFYENIPKILQEDKRLLLSTCDQLLKQFIYGGHRRMRAVTSHFDKTHLIDDDEVSNRNPFLGRRLDMQFDDENENFWNDVMSPLRKYGKHIWHSAITVNSHRLAYVTFYTILRWVLELLPNLKTLSIDHYNHSVGGYNFEFVRPNEIVLLNGEINLSPLPKINNLQSVKTKGVITPIFKEIINRNLHITSLDAYQMQMPKEEKDLFSVLLPNLKIFSMRCVKEEMFENFENAQLNPNLEELKFDLEYASTLEWGRVFRVLDQKCGKTVKKLEIRLPRKKGDFDEKEILEESASLRLNLPWVRNLILDLPRTACLDFILPMRESLESLDVAQCSYEVNRKSKRDLSLKYEQQKVNFVGWTSDLNASNIWGMFPKLKWIMHRESIQRFGVTWTRMEWEQELKFKSKMGVCYACSMNK